MLFSSIILVIVRVMLVCDLENLSSTVYQFDGFSFYSSSEQSNYWLEHVHEEIQITLPQPNAQAWMGCQSSTGKQYTQQIKVGESFLISSNQSHTLDWQQTAELTLFYLHPRFLANAIDDSIDNHHLEVNDRFSLVDDTLIREIGVIFRYLCRFDVATERLYIENLANLLAVYLLKNYLNYNLKLPRNIKGLSQSQINLVLEYIEANLDQKITLSDLAAIAGVGKFYFSRLFKNSLNLTPYRYVLQQRIEKAKRLLKYSNIPICDISLECGFSNQSHLAKHFRTIVGISAMNYRKSAKKCV